MTDGVDQEIRVLRSRFWSDRDPEGRAFVPLADACRRAGELDEALELVEEGLDRLPGFISGHVVAGWVHRDRGEPEAARDSFARALDLDPENLAALRGLGEMADAAGRRDEALEHYRRLYALESSDEALAARIADLQDQPDEPEPPVEAEPALTDEPADIEGIADTDEPAGTDEPAVAEDGQLSEDVLTATMAELYARQGMSGKAAAVYRRLLERDPGNERFRERLSELEAEARPAAGAEGSATVARYFEVLLSWMPGAVPVESLAPDGAEAGAGAGAGVAVGPAAPDDRTVVPIESLAPDGESLASDGESLAPDGESLASDDESPASDGADGVGADVPAVVPIESLAPDD